MVQPLHGWESLAGQERWPFRQGDLHHGRAHAQQARENIWPDTLTEFWAWCHKRKKFKEQKEAAVIAAGGTVPLPKAQKQKAKKAATAAKATKPKV